jgi:hypothetical protein
VSPRPGVCTVTTSSVEAGVRAVNGLGGQCSVGARVMTCRAASGADQIRWLRIGRNPTVAEYAAGCPGALHLLGISCGLARGMTVSSCGANARRAGEDRHEATCPHVPGPVAPMRRRPDTRPHAANLERC